MKVISRVFVFILATVLLFSSIISASAVTPLDGMQNLTENNGCSPAAFYDKCFGVDYGYTDWPSLGAAMNYYGTDYVYTYCGGSPYNYYYTFSDNSRMYFGVTEACHGG